MNTEETQRFKEIQEELSILVEEAYRLLDGTNVQNQAHGYWYADIKGAIYNETEFPGGSMITMDDTLQSIQELSWESEGIVPLCKRCAEDAGLQAESGQQWKSLLQSTRCAGCHETTDRILEANWDKYEEDIELL